MLTALHWKVAMIRNKLCTVQWDALKPPMAFLSGNIHVFIPARDHLFPALAHGTTHFDATTALHWKVAIVQNKLYTVE